MQSFAKKKKKSKMCFLNDDLYFEYIYQVTGNLNGFAVQKMSYGVFFFYFKSISKLFKATKKLPEKTIFASKMQKEQKKFLPEHK